MAKKKVTLETVEIDEPLADEYVVEVLEDAVVIEAVKKEPLLTVRVVENFKDGALAARFAALGYPVLWKAGETREIPMSLFVRCKRSGAKFQL